MFDPLPWLTCTGIRAFQFDRVFNGKDDQRTVHENSAAHAVVDLLNGASTLYKSDLRSCALVLVTPDATFSTEI